MIPHQKLQGPDDAIRGTNDDATVSRLSAAQLGYLVDPFAKLFVRRPVRRSPIINRGTFIRHRALDSLVQQFLQTPGPKKQIVTLGAGFDTRYFTIKSGPNADKLAKYFEVDFPELAVKKAMSIQRHAALHDLLGSKDDIHLERGGTELIGPDYCLVGGDLREWDQVADRLIHHGLDPNAPTLFLSECVFIYIAPKDSQYILEWITREVKQAMFVLYEQIKPDDAFGRMMLKNLQERSIELKGIHAYPDLKAQEQRFMGLGWKKAKAVDINELHDNWLNRTDRNRIAQLEILDELEEWHLLASHYCIAWAYKTDDPDSVWGSIDLQGQ
ncbi:leucine carboxyl methyltransferase 2-like protein [Phycomyces nitens]|nr:leucine carboxyl methyltransferase 2-like protein [Phycomyces nitens]